MKKYLLLSLFFCVACAAGHKIMTENTYSDVEVGMNEKELKTLAGAPYSIHKLANGVKEYEYIERVIVDDRTIEVRNYFFTIKDGVVTSKRVIPGNMRNRPLLERNAHDLQTTYNNEF